MSHAAISTSFIAPQFDYYREFDAVKIITPTVPIIAYYNHKGGVGKTALVHSHARAMAETYHKRVLMVDCDAQCSLTWDVLGRDIRKYERDGRVGCYHDWITRPSGIEGDKLLGRTMLDMLKPLGDRADFDLGRPIFEQINGVDPDGKGELFLLCGDVNITEVDNMVNMGTKLTTFSFMCSWVGGPYHAVAKAAIACSADIVLLDLSPSNGMMNRSLILSSTYVVAPCTLDPKSVQGVASFTNQLVTPDPRYKGRCWLEWRDNEVLPLMRDAKKNVVLQFPTTLPKILGWVLMLETEDEPIDQAAQLCADVEASLESLYVKGLVFDVFPQRILGRVAFDQVLNAKASEQNVPIAFVAPACAGVQKHRAAVDKTVADMMALIHVDGNNGCGAKRGRDD